MALRVKNIAAGFYDATGFHPIRSSSDYDPDRAGDEYSQRRPKAKRKKKRIGKKPKARKRARRKTASMPAPGFSPGAHRVESRKSNPIPAKWATAKVRRRGRDVQVMLFPGRRAPARRRRRAA